MSLDKIKKEYKKRNKINKMFPIHQEPMKERKEYDIDDYYQAFIALRDIGKYLSSELQNSINIQEDMIKRTIIDEIVFELNERQIDNFTFIDSEEIERTIGFDTLYILSLLSIDSVYFVYNQLLKQVKV